MFHFFNISLFQYFNHREGGQAVQRFHRATFQKLCPVQTAFFILRMYWNPVHAGSEMNLIAESRLGRGLGGASLGQGRTHPSSLY